ncbi:DUF6027 family protein [Nonomuraea rubra]|uniref:Uncharacterized protein n=1 Tax=Nonomuraea rubra TaxID=46180 RepID=A0A7X0TX34_9ACTN|nr:hypothetical protein [Nonomuraea rubra]
MERCVKRVKEWRGRASRLDKTPTVTWPVFISGEPSCGSAACYRPEDPNSAQAELPRLLEPIAAAEAADGDELSLAAHHRPRQMIACLKVTLDDPEVYPAQQPGEPQPPAAP